MFVGGKLTAQGYTGGGAKAVVDNMSSTGDMGYFDESGRLYIVGREDDMIVSGGKTSIRGRWKTRWRSILTSPTMRWSGFPTTGSVIV
ncbi:AMP-binding enzyme family protein [Mycobacterium xenopi 4042]|uniref:AMP-binding enzyme family protein n=1 Tax=Mycobacterium xenopi 4042 TaxID=1299334 RepID=X8CK74_MYCXE|nr:AMP-binding enzyme family protein [Mycobacterium xenopi 4042]